MFGWKRRRIRHSREHLSSLGDVAVVATAAVLSMSFVMNVVIRVGGLIFPRIFDPLSATIGDPASVGALVTVLGEIAAFQSMLGAAVLGATAIGISAMVLSILAWSFRHRGTLSVACSCAIMVAMATPLPDLVLWHLLDLGQKLWADAQGAHEALLAAVEASWGGPSGAMLIGTAAALVLSWYRMMLLLPSMPGMQLMPPSLRPPD